MSKIRRSVLVFSTNLYICTLIIVLCINHYLGGIQLQTETSLYSCLVLGGITIIPILMVLLSWESKWDKYEDEDKGYFIWFFFMNIIFGLGYSTLGDISNMVLLIIVSIIYLVSIWYLQCKLNSKSITPLVEPVITPKEYLISVCVMCGIQMIIVIIYWNFLKVYACALVIGVASILFISVLEVLLVLSNSNTLLRKRQITYLILTNVGMLVVMYAYLYFQIRTIECSWSSVRENHENIFVHYMANVLLIILQIPLWKYAISLDDSLDNRQIN